ncbi:MAG: hypothetical protein Q8P31_07550 [Bacillota bacterium]|nr:hypothetical protein [Bacillota bacterium]
MNVLRVLGNIDRRIIYLLLIVAIIGPLMRPIGLPTMVEPMTRQAYAAVNALQTGDVLCLAMDFSVGYKDDLMAGVIAMVQHALDRGANVIMPAVLQDGPMLADEVIRLFEGRGYKRGERLVNLGFRPGGETAVAAMARDMRGTYPQDHYGTPVDALPAMNGVSTAADFDLVIAVAVNITPGGIDWIKQVQGPFGTKTIFHSGTMLVPQFTPYLQSGQLVGMLKGISGSAQYESLINRPGPATASMEGQSMSHLLVIILVLLGNLAYLFGAKPGTTGAKGAK